MDSSLIGSTIGGYQIVDVIGRGGMGVVYKARDLALDRYAAVKMMEKTLAGSESFQKRFRSEARALAKVKHPNIVDVYAFHETEHGFCIMMEYCEGQTLAEVMQPGVPFDLTRSLRHIDQVASALEHAHEAGVAHRDIKPGNIMIQRDDRVKVMDFGLAKLKDATALTQTGTTSGSPGYMSPEQVKGEESDHRADIWAVGVVLYEMLSGKRPFSGDNAATLAYLILNTASMPVRQCNPLVPEEVEECINRCLQKDPAQRYRSIGEFRADISGFLGPKDHEGRTSRPNPFHPLKVPRWVLPLAGIVVGGLLLFLFFISSKAEMNIESDPSGAHVLLDEVDIGVTPIIGRKLSPGPVSIRISIPTYVERESLVVVRRWSSSTLFFSLQRKPQGELSVEMNPATGLQGKVVSPGAPNPADAVPDQRIPATVKKTVGGLQIVLSTNRGLNSLLFVEGDTMRVFVRVNQAAYIRVIYNVVDGKRILLTGPRDSRLTREKTGVDVPLGEFICGPPFGAETIQAFASEEAFEPTRSSVKEGLCYLIEDPVVALTRGIQSIPKHIAQAEVRLQLRTVARAKSGRAGTP